MLLIIEARIADGGDAVDGAVTLAVVERRDRSLSVLGLTLAEGRALLAQAQTALVSQQVDGWLSGQKNCRLCGSVLSHKDKRPSWCVPCTATWQSGARDCGPAVARRRLGHLAVA